MRQQTLQVFLNLGNEPKTRAILHTVYQTSVLPNFENLSKTCNLIFLFKRKGSCLQPQPSWLHHLFYYHSHGNLVTGLNKCFLFNIKVIYWLWKEPILATIGEEKELAVAAPSSPASSHDEAASEQRLFHLHCSLNFHFLLIPTTHNTSLKRNISEYIIENSFPPRPHQNRLLKWKKLFTNILHARFHPLTVPVVWENLFSHFLPSELVPVSHLEVESFSEPP